MAKKNKKKKTKSLPLLTMMGKKKIKAF